MKAAAISERVIELHEAGYKLKEIAEALNCTPQWAGQVLKKANLRKPGVTEPNVTVK